MSKYREMAGPEASKFRDAFMSGVRTKGASTVILPKNVKESVSRSSGIEYARKADYNNSVPGGK